MKGVFKNSKEEEVAMEIEVSAWGKLNLSLDVVKKLPSGYHDMRMVMETVELHDEIHIALSAGSGVQMETNLSFLPVDNRNIAAQAAELFFRELELPEQRVSIRIQKQIPVAAGMAGGSANAAAVLCGLNTLLETGLDRAALMELGAKLGADVPYCILGGTALATGIGVELTPLPPLPPCHIVICKPKFSVRTPEMFARIDCGKVRHRPDTNGIIRALEAGSLGEVAIRMYNVFEDVLTAREKEVAQIKNILLDCGALGAVMTGSGPSVFALFDDETLAKAAYTRLKRVYRETFLTKNRSESTV